MPAYKLHSEHIQLFDISKEVSLFYHTESLQIYPISDKDILNFLRLYQLRGYVKTKESYEESEFSRLYHFICNTLKKAPKLNSLSLPDLDKENYRTVILPISAACNLNCPYCFAQTDGGFHFNDFSIEDTEKIISFVMDNNPDKTKKLGIIFFGGEPLLRIDIIEYAIKYIKERYPDRPVYYSLTTNGTIVNDKVIQLLKDNHVSVLVSLDGYDNEFNLRKFKNGNKSIYKVLDNIHLLKENNIPIELRATLVSDNPYLLQTVDFFEQLKIPYNIVFAYSSENKSHHLSDYNPENLASIQNQLKDVLQYYIDKLQKGEFIYNNLFLKNVFAIRYRVNKNIACGAGIGLFTITGNGDIYSCAHLMNNPSYSIGNIREGIKDKSRFMPVPVNEIEDCKSCWAKYLCLGNCFSQKISTGKTNHSSKLKAECELERLLWSFYIKLYYYIKTINPTYFQSLESKNLYC